MHHEDRAIDPELVKRLIDHPRLDLRRRFLSPPARAPAMAGTIDQNHAAVPGEDVAERPSHRFEIGARAVEHHDRKARIAGTDIDDVKPRAVDLDHPALRGKARCTATIPACVTSANRTSAVTTDITIMEKIRVVLGTRQLRV